MLADARSGLVSRLGEQPEAVAASLDQARFDAPGSQPHPRLCDEQPQSVKAGAVIRVAVAVIPGQPPLHGLLEAQLAGIWSLSRAPVPWAGE